MVHLHYSLSVQFPTCFPLPTSRRDRRGAVGREPSNSTGGTLTRVRASCAGCCTVTMQLENWLALTLTLSPRRGNSVWPRWDESPEGEVIGGARELLPLPGGEGWGEGERIIRLNRSGFARCGMVELGFGVF